MKNVRNMKRVIAAVVVMVGFATNSNAQSNATASSTAVLVTPLSIIKNVDMHFGTVAASATPGTIALDYDNTVTPGAGAAVINNTQAKAAKFTVTGSGAQTFTIALTTTSVVLTDGTNNLTVNGITCDEGTGSTLIAGSKELFVKGTLQVTANAVAGTYTNAAGLEVTVAYN